MSEEDADLLASDLEETELTEEEEGQEQPKKESGLDATVKAILRETIGIQRKTNDFFYCTLCKQKLDSKERMVLHVRLPK